jgi:hypothetical protein
MWRYFLVPVALLIGCATVGEPTKNESQWILASELVLDVTAEPAVLEPGDTLHIRLAVKNPRDAPVWTGFADGCIFGFTVRNGLGEVVAPPPRVCTQRPEVVKFAPKEVIVAEFRWRWDGSKLAPGTYSVFAGFGVTGEGGPVVEIQLKQNTSEHEVGP